MPVKFKHDEFALHEPQFYWPESDENARYPNGMARAGALLVKELARVGWDVPNIDVEIDTYGAGENLIRTVRRISGVTEDGPFELRFNGPEGRIGRFNICKGLQEATIPPGIEIHFYDDRSGPTAYLYTGRRWKQDGAEFIRNLKVNSKLRGDKRLYLKYSGRGGCGVLRHDHDLNREYSPKRFEPSSLDSVEIARDVAKFVDGLRASLARLPTAPGADDVTPQGDANMRRMARVEMIPAPEDFPPLYTWVERNDAYRIRGGNPNEPEQRYGLSGNGWRLCNYGVHADGLHPRAHDGFTYASADPAAERAGQVVYGAKDESVPAVVRLKWLNDVFVVDNAKYDQVRKEVWRKAESEGRDRITDAEVNRCIAATGLTMVPVTEYAGGYEKPVYLIGRQTAIEEVRLVRGTITMSVDDDAKTTRVVVKDDESGTEFTLFERDQVGDRTSAWARREAEQAARLLTDRRIRDRLPPPSEPEPEAAAPGLGL